MTLDDFPLGTPVKLDASGLVGVVGIVAYPSNAFDGPVPCVYVAGFDDYPNGRFIGCTDFPISKIAPLTPSEIQAASADEWRALCAKYKLPGLRVRARVA